MAAELLVALTLWVLKSSGLNILGALLLTFVVVVEVVVDGNLIGDTELVLLVSIDNGVSPPVNDVFDNDLCLPRPLVMSPSLLKDVVTLAEFPLTLCALFVDLSRLIKGIMLSSPTLSGKKEGDSVGDK